jgi:hypothetical protein
MVEWLTRHKELVVLGIGLFVVSLSAMVLLVLWVIAATARLLIGALRRWLVKHLG